MNKALYRDNKTKRIAALTIARNADRFIERWIAHYGAALGYENLYVIFDGMDQKLPHSQNTSPFQSVQYLSARPIGSSLSALGVDVARNQAVEAPLDWNAPFLGQRGFGLLSDRYTKACIITRPVRWGSGFHRVKGQKFRIDPNLFLFHFGSVDTQEINARFEDAERASNGWTSHQKRRASVSEKITSSNPLDGDTRFPTARTSLSRARSLFAWNKPRPLKSDDVVKIPTRFYGVV